MSLKHVANYSCKKFSLTLYPPATVHPLQTDRQTTTRTNGWPLSLQL